MKQKNYISYEGFKEEYIRLLDNLKDAKTTTKSSLYATALSNHCRLHRLFKARYDDETANEPEAV